MPVLQRSKAAQETGQEFRVPLTALRNTDGSLLGTAASAGKWGLVPSVPAFAGGAGSGGVVVEGEAASGNTKTSDLMLTIPVPINYVADAAFQIDIDARTSVVLATGSTLDIAVYISDGNGGVSGSDIYAGAAVDINSASWATKSFVLTDTNLSPGQELVVWVRGVANDSTGANNGKQQIGSVTASMTTRM